MKKILTIAGYDPSSGAGITKDLEIFYSLGIHGISAPTCMVLQGPKGVRDAYPVPYPQFYEMVDMVRGELPIDGIKIGAVWNEAYVDKVASFLNGAGDVLLVIDPIIAAKNGTRLLTDTGLKRMIEMLFPKADVVTPNIDEASAITGKKVATLKDMRDCAKSLLDLGPKTVVIKGGHLKGEPVDLFYNGKEFMSFKRQRIDRTVHGTGCIFSSMMISFLANGYDEREAFVASGNAMGELLGDSYRIDKDGYFYASPGITNSVLSERWRVVQALKQAGEILKRDNIVRLIPAVQLNVGYAIKNARGVEDIAAFPGRIGCHEGQVFIKGEPVFGASSHVAKLILTCMKHYPHMRSCANIRYDRTIVEKALNNGLNVLFSDRKEGPGRVKEAERGALDLLVDEALKGTSNPPDIIYDLGDTGREPIVGLFARDPLEITKKMEMISL
jgi:hydroxymethylpyrimidine kinase / phosphomethylpyrimidine kinase / thiamine-phosphate diphosphorylase